MSTQTKPSDAADSPREAAPAPDPTVKVRITKHRTHAQHRIYPAGAIVAMPKSTADSLVSLGFAQIVGV